MTKTIEAIWQLLQQHQGETFHTAKGLPLSDGGWTLAVARASISFSAPVGTRVPFWTSTKWMVSNSLSTR